jgi:glycosyltransferase involved in cell wall biosynthesis
MNAPLPVMFTHYGDDWFRGSEQVLLDLVTNLDRDRVEPIVWCNGAAMAEAARKAGVPTYQTPFEYYFDYSSPRFDPRRYLSFVREGIAIVRKHDIKVLHANSAAPHQWLLPVARSARVPVLAHLHIDYRRRGRFVCLLHQADLIVGVSRQVTQDFLRDGTPPERTRTIYNGIDFARLSAGQACSACHQLGIAPASLVITAAGSLVHRKGHDVLLRAFAQLPRDRDIRLVIAGDGPERAAYEALAGDLGVRPRVHFVGHAGRMADIYRASDIVALASRADAFGLVLAEAGYFRLPAVATKVGGIPEVIEDGVTGLLVPPDDPDALATAITRLINDPEQRLALGRAAKARVERLFGVGQMVDSFHATYDDLARRPVSSLGWREITVAPYVNAILRR